jgi:ATPase subunit of ABC transporter with duplicated ATPase domains
LSGELPPDSGEVSRRRGLRVSTLPQEFELEATLNGPAFYATQASEAPRLIAALETARAEAARLYARWQELDAIGK